MKKTILILSYSNLISDPRVYKQMLFLKDNYEVKVLGINDPCIKGVEYIPCWSLSENIGSYTFRTVELNAHSKILRSRFPDLNMDFQDYAHLIRFMLPRMAFSKNFFEKKYWNLPYIKQALDALRGHYFDVILANDYDMLPLAVRISRARPIIFDSHEFAPKQQSSLGFYLYQKPYRHYLLKKYLPQVRAVTTVCPYFVKDFKKFYNINARTVYNVPFYEHIRPTLSKGPDIHLIHHGGASPSRALEKMIHAVRALDKRFHLDMMLVSNNQEYVDFLKKTAQGDGRIRFIKPVPMQEISKFISRYDIGLYMLPPTNYNQKYALPNKFFEFIQARLALAVGPSHEMAQLVRLYHLGIIAKDFTAKKMALALSQVDLRQVAFFKENASRIAYEWSAQGVKSAWLDIIGEVLCEPDGLVKTSICRE